MSYTINLCEMKELCSISDSDMSYKTIEIIKGNIKLLSEYYEFQYFLEQEYDTTDVDKIIEERNVTLKEIIDEFERTDSYYDFVENFEPMMCHIHITQYAPSNEEIELLINHCPGVVWLELEGIFQGLGMTGAGMDFSDTLELAYYIVDRKSPIEASQRLTVGEKEWEVILKMREAVRNGKNFDVTSELEKIKEECSNEG